MKPRRKVVASAVGAAIATAIVGTATWLGAPDPPVGLEGAFATLAAFAVGWRVPDAT